jgi:hypothetical protein
VPEGPRGEVKLSTTVVRFAHHRESQIESPLFLTEPHSRLSHLNLPAICCTNHLTTAIHGVLEIPRSCAAGAETSIPFPGSSERHPLDGIRRAISRHETTRYSFANWQAPHDACQYHSRGCLDFGHLSPGQLGSILHHCATPARHLASLTKGHCPSGASYGPD